MTFDKYEMIRDLITRLDLAARLWRVVDHWSGDRQAIGVAAERDPRRLVYVSTFSRAAGRYDYECELPEGPDLDTYSTAGSGVDVDGETLLGAMEAHLEATQAT